MRGFSFLSFSPGVEDMNSKTKFFQSGMMLTAVALAMRTVSMFFGAFVTAAVGTEGTGLYTIVMTVYSFAVTFATSGISLTVTRLVASAIGEGVRSVSSVLRSALVYAMLFGISASLILFFGADFLGEHILFDQRSTLSLKVLSFSLVPIALGSVFSGYFVGVKRVGFNASVQVLAQIAKIALTVILVIKMAAEGVASAVAALCLGITATEIFAFGLIFCEYLYDRKKTRREGEKKSDEMGEVVKTALPIAFSAYVRSALLTLEHILIPRRLMYRGESSGEAYSNYGLLHGMALPVVTYPMSPLSSFSGLLVPEFAEDMSAGRHRRMDRIATSALNTTLTYAIAIGALIYSFSEELGYVIYHSYDVGQYISMLAPVIPIMYLDHVTDSMLKGIGEQVFSMWVNITDSLLSVILVWLLIPVMGISGYAIVIVIMEGYNFLLSFLRLKSKIKFKLDIKRAAIIPLAASAVASYLADFLFKFSGSSVRPLWLIFKMLFSVAITVFLISLTKIKSVRAEKGIENYGNT